MNPISPTVELELEGKKYTLRLDFNALVNFEETTGITIFELQNQASARSIRALLWACIRSGSDPEINIEDVGRLIHSGNMTKIISSLSDLMNNSLIENGENNTEAEESPLAGNEQTG
ncbi:MAG: hypothetical protein JRI54_00155 [Deltaproteobacteria bacterium]|nr:hypothetical protein [Deltaproteobacteria bacterium]